MSDRERGIVAAWRRRATTAGALSALLIASSGPAAGATVTVESTIDCPTEDDVAARLDGLVRPGTPMGYRLILSAGTSPDSLQIASSIGAATS